MASYNKHYQFTEDLAKKVHNLATDTLKVLLTNTAPTASNSVYANLSGAEVANGNGYTTGGATAAQVSCVQSTGTLTLTCTNVTWTASGAVGPFRYADLYNSTPSSPLKPLIAWWDYGSSISLANGDTFTVAFNGGGSSGSVLTLA